MNNHPEIINKEYPAEGIRTIPDVGITEKPFSLREAEYINLMSNKTSWFSRILIGIIIGILVSIIKLYLENNNEFIKVTDIQILIGLIIFLAVAYLVEYFFNTPKRDIKKLIKRHFEANRLDIEEQRKFYGRKK